MERQSGNSIIQGSCADLLKIAMRNLHEKLKPHDGHILLTVHDELIVEVPIEKAEEMKLLVQFEMEHAVKLSTVNLKAEPKISPFWVK
jgi:DNA polymerase-1